MKKYCFFTLLLLVALVLAIYSINFYFLSRLSSQISGKSRYIFGAEQVDNEEQSSDDQATRLKAIYRNRNPKYSKVRDSLVRNFAPCKREWNFSQIWREADAVSSLLSLLFNPYNSSLSLLSVVEEHNERDLSGA
jgi:hypothetical protein